MSNVYVIGHITVKDAEKWTEYRSRVPATLAPWGAELIFRGKRATILAGELPHVDAVVIIRFPGQAALDGWHSSTAYQELLPLRREAVDIVLLSYEE